jgi:hypothetical protein
VVAPRRERVVTLLRFPGLDVTRLAADFSAAIRDNHTAAELAAIRQRNEAEQMPGIDHAHDFLDPNDLMSEAVLLQVGHVEDWSHYADEMDAAWTKAKASGYRLSRVLVGCEFSGTVRDAFAARGHSVMSCDLLPTESPGAHYQGDVRDIVNDGWHIGIFHPSCTNLTNSGVKHLVRGGERIDPERWDRMKADAEFFRDLGQSDIKHVARENPVMHGYAREIVGRKADQYVQPYHYGHDVSKRTGLWLDNLPKLTDDPANHVAPRVIEYRGRKVKRWSNQSPCGADSRGPSADRGHKRSVFFTGIAEAMADQWGGIVRAARQATTTATQLELFA